MALPEAEQAEREQRVLARWDRRQQALRGLPLFLWGALYAFVGLPMVCLGLIGTLAGWQPQTLTIGTRRSGPMVGNRP
jgi:hypothetical protein